METKVCGVCQEEKPTDDFYKFKDSRNKNGKGIYLKYLCKECDKKNGLKQKTKSRQRKREFLWEYKKTHPCVDCSESNPIVLQFDHVRGDKHMNITEMSSGGHSLRKLQEEIKKCVVRCANCHLRKTAKDQNWYEVEMTKEGCTVDEWNQKFLEQP